MNSTYLTVERCVKIWLFLFVIYIAQTGSIYCIVAMTMERFIVVTYPLKAHHLCTWNRARFYVIGILIGGTLLNLYRLWELETQTIENVTLANETNAVTYTYSLDYTPFKYTIWARVFDITVSFVINMGIPLVVLIVFNVKIWIQVSMGGTYLSLKVIEIVMHSLFSF